MNKIIALFNKQIIKNKFFTISNIVIISLILLIVYEYFSPKNVVESITNFINEIPRLIYVISRIAIIVIVVYVILKIISRSKAKQCPRCDSTNLKMVKPGLMQKATKGSAFLLFGAFALGMKEPKNLNVCRDCGFSWEDR